ncbi:MULTISPECIES: serine hydrolase domain-containing protein [Streptomyces]|uniref:serine hydrolase domain-containing protein n=1 Tax=Streptomyces TaxID=1883 RepID=UPI000CD5988D|nr:MULTISPECIES: serine hydrolase domain-containing protein [Streptomyces]
MSPAATEGEVRARLAETLALADAPDAILGYSRRGERVVLSGGTAEPPAQPREKLRYEIGSAAKTYNALLLADLVHSGELRWNDRAADLLSPRHPTGGQRATLTHLVTHTSGLPRLPADFYRQAVPRWTTNPYAGYPAERVVAAFLRPVRRPRHRPGTRWRYSNFGAAVLGHTMAAHSGLPWEELLDRRVLRPLGLADTATAPGDPGTDATGHRRDGTTEVPALEMGGFQAAGAVRATPDDLLTFLEAQLRPEETPLAAALRALRRPVLRRGIGHRHTHTLTWFHHPGSRGPVLFHAGATSGQQALLAFRPETDTALVALTTRRFRVGDPFPAAVHALLDDLP